MKLVLRGELQRQWAGLDPFTEVGRLAGTVVRDKEGRQTLRFERAGKTYYRKLHTGVGWREICKNLLQGRLPVIGAGNEWRAINRLHELGVDTLTAVGYGERGINPATRLSFLVTEELTGTLSLAKFAERWPASPPVFALRLALIEKVAAVARTLHRHGINHRDLYICHFLVDISGGEVVNPDTLRLYLVDLHRAQMRSRVPRRWLVKDLASLYFSALDIGLTRRDVLRFLRVYFERPPRKVLREQRALLLRVKVRAIRLYRRDFGRTPRPPL